MATFTSTSNADGYRIFRDGVLLIDQRFKPGVPGLQPFASEAEAEAAAQAEVARLTAETSRPIPDISTAPPEIQARLRSYR